MHAFLLDVWQDLREKRMWPVAAALAIALLAIPVVVAKPASSPKPSVAPQSAAQSPDPLTAVKVQLADLQDGKGSALDRFQEKNPFLPPGKLLKQLKGATSATATSTATAAASSASGTGAGASAGGASTGAPASGGGGSAPAAPTTGAPGSGHHGTSRVTQYTYVADVTFWTNGRRHAYRGMRRLRMLPSEESPFLVFLGVDASGNNGVFLVDSTLTATGEGKCTPSGKECAVLSLGPGSEEEFTTADGQSLRLRIDEIRRVRLSSGASASASAHRRPRAHAARATRRFELPMLIDLVTVASPAGAPSSSSARGR